MWCWGAFGKHYPLYQVVLWCSLFFYYQHGQHVKGVTIIESSLGMRWGDPLGNPLYVLAHYWVILKTIAQAPNYIFPTLVDDIHIMWPMSEITRTFDHLSTQLALVRLKVKMSKYKLRNPLGLFPGLEIPQSYTLTRRKKKEVLFMWNKKVNKLHMRTKCRKQPKCLPGKEYHQYVPHPKIKPHSKNTWQSLQNPLAHPKCVSHFFVDFDRKIMQICGDIMGPRSWESFQGPLMKH